MKKLMIVFVIVFAAALVLAGYMNSSNQTTNEEDSESVEEMTDETMVSEADDMMEETADETMENLGPNPLDFVATDIEGNQWNLADLGERAVIKVWASWCPICLSGMEEYNTFSNEYKDGLVLTVVTPDMYGEMSKDDFSDWYKGLDGYENIVVIFDDEGTLIQTAGIRGFPTFVYLNSDGWIEHTAVGHQNNDVIEETLGKVS